MNEKVNPKIYEHPSVVASMKRIGRRYIEEDGAELSLHLRLPWNPGEEPVTYTSAFDEKLDGCVEIYNPLDGRLF